MNKLRVNTGAVKIEVNDQGEFITLNFGDQEFPLKVVNLIEKFEVEHKRLKAISETIEIPGDITGEKIDPNFKKLAEVSLQSHKMFKEEIDVVFGDETCRKVFGNIVPSMDHISQFLTAIQPYFENHREEMAVRAEVQNQKYNPERLGNV